MVSTAEFKEALHEAGISKGDTLFCHSNIAFFGKFDGVYSQEKLCEFILDCVLDVVGEKGTLILPAFTYSFGANKKVKEFDKSKSRSTVSALSNFLMDNKLGKRSLDPMLSTVTIGYNESYFSTLDNNICFGSSSVFEKMYDVRAKICNFNLDCGSTFLHWIERKLNVPYRRDILMSGYICDGNERVSSNIKYFGRIDTDDPSTQPDFEKYHRFSIEEGICTIKNVGRGQIVTQNCELAFKKIFEKYSVDPELLIKGCN